MLMAPVPFNRQIRVLAVDRNALMREGLASLIRLRPDMQLIGAMATAEEALQIFLERRPDVTVMDLDAPSAATHEAIRKIRARNASARFIGLTTYGPNDAWAEALAAGASHCLGKDRLRDSLPPTIRKGTP